MADATSVDVDGSEEERAEEEDRQTEGDHAAEDDSIGGSSLGLPTVRPATGSASLSQSTLVPYRTPVLPNLAKAALERLQKRNPEHDDSQSNDFQPVKKRKVEESGEDDEENEVTL